MALLLTVAEVSDALGKMRAGKSPGLDNLPIELILAGGGAAREALVQLTRRIWDNGTIPSDFKIANIITIFKKGDRSNCNNYRGISLLSAAGKCFACILLSRLLVLAEEVLPESQCRFRSARGTTDKIFCARQLQEKAREQRGPLLYIFWDLKKAFDKIPRPAMWATLRRFGCPLHFINLIRGLNDGMLARVCHRESLSDSFDVTGGLKQGCVLAPTLFALYLAAMLYELPANSPSIELRYRFDGSLFNLARSKARTKTSYLRITELQHADDNATPASSPEELQQIADFFHAAYERFGMEVNSNKTKVLMQPAPGQPPNDLDIVIGRRNIEIVHSFPYLGSLLTSSATSLEDINSRIGAANASFGCLNKKVFNKYNLTIDTKSMVYRSVVLPTLLYGSETWTL